MTTGAGTMIGGGRGAGAGPGPGACAGPPGGAVSTGAGRGLRTTGGSVPGEVCGAVMVSVPSTARSGGITGDPVTGMKMLGAGCMSFWNERICS